MKWKMDFKDVEFLLNRHENTSKIVLSISSDQHLYS